MSTTNSKIDYEPDNMDGNYLGEISRDFVKVAENLKEASYQIRAKGFSEHPIFIISKTEVAIGVSLFKLFELGNEWHYNASMLEEFIQRGLVHDEDVFKEKYKNPDEFCSLFVVDEEFVNFVFIPYPED